MGSPWLLASCHEEEATARVLEKNMTREVEAAELLRNRSHSYNLGRSSPAYSWHPTLPHQTLTTISCSRH